MSDQEIIKELYDACVWYEREEKELLKKAKEYRTNIERNKRLIALLQNEIDKEEQQ